MGETYKLVCIVNSEMICDERIGQQSCISRNGMGDALPLNTHPKSVPAYTYVDYVLCVATKNFVSMSS